MPGLVENEIYSFSPIPVEESPMTQDNATSANEGSLDRVIAAYLEAVDAGQKPNPQEWLA